MRDVAKDLYAPPATRVPPQSIEVEQSVLGAMLVDRWNIDTAFELLTVNDFYRPSHRMIYEAMVAIHWDGENVDLLSVENYLRDEGKIDTVGKEYLSELTGQASTDIEYACRIVKEKAIKRNLISNCTEIIKEAYDSSTDVYDVVDKAQGLMFDITAFQEGTLSEIHETVHKVAERVSKIQETGEPIGIKSGLDIDKSLLGFQGSKLYILGARPSMGKTALVMTIMRNCAREKIKTGILSLETSDESLGIRLIAQSSGIPAEKITSGKMSSGEYDLFLKACKELSKHGILIDDKAAITAQQARAKCRIMANRGAEMIFVDFLQLLRGEGRSKHEEIGGITKVLKQVSKELDIPIVALSQLSREVEKRGDKRPMLADLRESGSIEEDADIVMFLYRPEYYGTKTDVEGRSTKGIAEVIVAKNKDGRTGLHKLLFREEVMRFENISPY